MITGDLVRVKMNCIAWDQPARSEHPQVNLGNLKADEHLIVLGIGSASLYCLTRFGPAWVDQIHTQWCIENLTTYRILDP